MPNPNTDILIELMVHLMMKFYGHFSVVEFVV